MQKQIVHQYAKMCRNIKIYIAVLFCFEMFEYLSTLKTNTVLISKINKNSYKTKFEKGVKHSFTFQKKNNVCQTLDYIRILYLFRNQESIIKIKLGIKRYEIRVNKEKYKKYF